MSATPEQIQAALFALTDQLQDVPFKERSRIIQEEAGAVPTNQPALYQVWLGREAVQLTGTPPVWKYNFWWVLYVDRGESPTALASQAVAPLVDACDSVLAPAPGLDAQTLGGLVSWARQEGKVEVSEAPLGQQVVAVYAITVLVPRDLTC